MLIGKLVLFIVGNYIVLEFNKQKPEDLMEYPGFGYCLVMHFGLGQLLYNLHGHCGHEVLQKQESKGVRREKNKTLGGDLEPVWDHTDSMNMAVIRYIQMLCLVSSIIKIHHCIDL